MSTEARAEHFPAADWDGGTLPYRVGHRKLGMWLFIVSDSLTFSALLIGYSYLRASNNLAHAVSVLSQHRLLFGDDVLSAVVELDDGVRCFRFQSRRQGEGTQVDPCHHRSSVSRLSCCT